MHLDCCLIGENNLLISCGNALLARHHTITLIISPFKNVHDWAKGHAIPCFFPGAQSESLINSPEYPVDYLFSIVNSQIFSADILKAPKLGAINYHDSLLPDYAGLNASTWAIFNNETEHGVTWHLVNEHIDEGDILCQQRININRNETALSLNSRCYEAAISSFQRLLCSLEQNSAQSSKQNPENRRYYGAGHPLPNLGFIDWENDSAAFLERTCRALSFGHYHNPVGSLKWRMGDDYCIVTDLDIVKIDTSAIEAGTVLDINTCAVTIATKDQAIRVNRLTRPDGKTEAIGTWLDQHQLRIGSVLPSRHHSQDTLSDNDYTRLLKNESLWIERLKQHSDHACFQKKYLAADKDFQPFGQSQALQHPDPAAREQILITALLLYLFRLNDYDPVSVHLARRNTHLASPLLSAFVPLIVDLPPHDSLSGALTQVGQLLTQTLSHDGFLTDIVARNKQLHPDALEMRLVIGHQACSDAALPKSAVLYVQIDEDQGCVRAFHRLDSHCQGGALRTLLDNFSAHIDAVLAALQRDASQQINQFCFLSPQEREQLLTSLGQGESRPLPNTSIHALFDQQAARNPQATAVIHGEQRMSYQQLWQASEAVAASLQSSGAPAAALVGVYLTRSPDLLAVMLGILKAGCAYVPLDTKHPLLKTENNLNEAHISYVITEAEYQAKLRAHFAGKRQINWLIASDMLSFVPGKKRPASEEELAYVLFTSGTTLSPKGVMITHQNVINYCLWFLESTGCNEDSVVDFSASPAFDLSVPCSLAPLLAGAAVAICSDSHKTNPQQYLRHLQTQRVSHVEATPGYLELLLNYPDEIKRLPDLRCLLLGADVVPSSDVLHWMALCPDHILFNEYGPTETTVSATSFRVRSSRALNEFSVPIGRPAHNSSCYLLDKHDNLCPIGMKGELHIGGAQVAKGYLNNEAMTVEKFRKLKLGDVMEVLHKTGDMAYWLPDGNLQFSGRNDQQVKRQGYRIELAEIESVLMALPGIKQAVVVLRPADVKGHALRACLVAGTTSISDSELRNYLADHLPAYMIPDEFYMLDAIPLKENEKIDFHSLNQQPGKRLSTQIPDSFFDSSPIEAQIRLIWQRIIKQQHIGLHDDFFEIGGDSLMALQLVTELKKCMKIHLSLQSLFEYPTISRLADKIQSLKDNTVAYGFVRKPPLSIVPLSKGTNPIPLFLIHPIGGTVFCYKQLASHLNGKFTLYGIQDPGLNGNPQRFNNLEDMASQYLYDIQSVYQGETFFLGGASFGATVAFDMAHQLGLSGKKPAFLGLFDGWTAYPPDILAQTTARSLRHQRSLNSELNMRLIELEWYRRDLLINYRLPAIDSQATLFKAEQVWPELLPINSADNGWARFIKPELIIQPVPGDHGTMLFGSNAVQLADILESALLHSQSGDPSLRSG